MVVDLFTAESRDYIVGVLDDYGGESLRDVHLARGATESRQALCVVVTGCRQSRRGSASLRVTGELNRA